MAAMATWWTPTETGVRCTIHVSPGARRSQVVGVVDDALRVRVAAPPVDGKANRELARVLANHLGVRPSAVTVAQGASSRRKVVDVRGGDELRRRLEVPPAP